MSKALTEMTNEDLWALFPIVLSPHNPQWTEQYRQERELLEQDIGRERIARISHCGSTSVPGLVAKPTVDILVEIRSGTPLDAVTAAMERAGYLFAPQPDKPPPHMMFMKGYTPQGFAQRVFHVHVRYPGDWDELYFRDYLREHPDTAAEYGGLKQSLSRRFEHDRDGYTAAKTEFIKGVTALARQAYGERYVIPE